MSVEHSLLFMKENNLRRLDNYIVLPPGN